MADSSYFPTVDHRGASLTQNQCAQVGQLTEWMSKLVSWAYIYIYIRHERWVHIHDAKNWQTAVDIWSDKSFLVRGKRTKLFLLILFKFFTGTSSLLSTVHITRRNPKHHRLHTISCLMTDWLIEWMNDWMNWTFLGVNMCNCHV